MNSLQSIKFELKSDVEVVEYDGDNPTSSQVKKRRHHNPQDKNRNNWLEKNRRDEIKELIKKLKDTLPTLKMKEGRREVSRRIILQETLGYIDYLKKENIELQNKVKSLEISNNKGSASRASDIRRVKNLKKTKSANNTSSLCNSKSIDISSEVCRREKTDEEFSGMYANGLNISCSSSSTETVNYSGVNKANCNDTFKNFINDRDASSHVRIYSTIEQFNDSLLSDGAKTINSDLSLNSERAVNDGTWPTNFLMDVQDIKNPRLDLPVVNIFSNISNIETFNDSGVNNTKNNYTFINDNVNATSKSVSENFKDSLHSRNVDSDSSLTSERAVDLEPFLSAMLMGEEVDECLDKENLLVKDFPFLRQVSSSTSHSNEKMDDCTINGLVVNFEENFFNSFFSETADLSDTTNGKSSFIDIDLPILEIDSEGSL